MSETTPDLVITAGRVFCADTGINGPGGVAIKDGRIVASGADVSGPSAQALYYPDATLLPGLVDLHAHPAPESWRWGIDADSMMLRRGSTTVMSQGDAGARTWAEYQETIIDASDTRILMALSPAVFGEHEDRGVFIHLDEVDVEECAAAIEADGTHIWGLASNLTDRACGDNDPREVMRRIIAIAERAGKPILYGTRKQPYDWPLGEQLETLRPGDVVTYCFIDPDETVESNGRVVEELWKARERGILFDLGIGKGTSDMGAAEAAIADGFLPDTVSSDIHNRHVGWDQPHDLPMTISRIMATGMTEEDAFTRATLRPAQVLGLAGEVGTLAPGACGDVSVLQHQEESVTLADAPEGDHSGRPLVSVATVRGGRVFEP